MSIIGQSTGTLTRQGHRLGVDTGVVNPLHIDEYGGEVESSFVKKSMMRGFLNVKTVRGTDTVTNDRIGESTLQKVTPGVRPTSHANQFDNISLKVDTIVLARSNQALIDDFQEHYDTRMKVGEEHGKKIGKFFDEAIIIQGIKAALLVTEADGGTYKAPPGFQSGNRVELALAGDENDPDKLQRAIEDLCQAIEEKDVDIENARLLVRPAQYYVLLRNDKLIDSDFSDGNGNYAQGKVLRANGVPIVKTNRIPSADITGHYLSNVGNNNAYDISGEETDCVALLLMPKALLAGETIPLTSKVYYSDVELQWFIDSYLSFGVTPNRPEHAGVVLKYRA